MSLENRYIIETYLKGRDWTSPTTIGQEAAKKPYYCASAWASPKCKKLAEKGILERNNKGHYRLPRADG